MTITELVERAMTQIAHELDQLNLTPFTESEEEEHFKKILELSNKHYELCCMLRDITYKEK